MTSVSSFPRKSVDRFITTLVIGAGQAGLSMSHCLTKAGIDHALLERGEVANSWKTERWDSLRLLSPNWQTRLAGYQYQGDNPDGFMSGGEFTEYLQNYAQTLAAPIYCGVEVLQVSSTQNGYRVVTNQGDWQCRALVIATGACSKPVIPKLAEQLPDYIHSLTPAAYKNPEQLPEGGVLVVGASASGLQLASEIQKSGRQVTIATGEQVRMPRRYRGRDMQWWLDQMGLLADRYDEVEDLERLRRLPSAQLVGSDTYANLDLNSVQAEGVEVVGRLAFIHDNKMQFSGSLANVCKMADLKMRRLLKRVDEFIATQDYVNDIPPPDVPADTCTAESPKLELDLRRDEIKTVIWATGFRPDYDWLKVPVLDAKGRLKHDGGVVNNPGLYVLGLPFMRRRNSQFIDGVAHDAEELAQHMSAYLQNHWQANQFAIA